MREGMYVKHAVFTMLLLSSKLLSKDTPRSVHVYSWCPTGPMALSGQAAIRLFGFPGACVAKAVPRAGTQQNSS